MKSRTNCWSGADAYGTWITVVVTVAGGDDTVIVTVAGGCVAVTVELPPPSTGRIGDSAPATATPSVNMTAAMAETTYSTVDTPQELAVSSGNRRHNVLLLLMVAPREVIQAAPILNVHAIPSRARYSRER